MYKLLDTFHTKNDTFDRRFTQFGGIRDANGDFVPTGETLAFIVAGADLETGLALQAMFDRDQANNRGHPLAAPMSRTKPTRLE